MKSKLTKYTNDLKAQKWTEIVVNCNESGMSKTFDEGSVHLADAGASN